MDYFSEWLEVYPIPNQEALTVADALVTNFLCYFGIIQELHNDQGHNFESKLTQKVLECLGTRPEPLIYTQWDGMAEQYVKTVKDHQRKVVSTHRCDWDVRLPIFLLVH
jgi:hypothetical protein